MKKTGSYLFVSCPYAEMVWKAASIELKSQESHEGSSLDQKCHSWWTDSLVRHLDAFPSSCLYGIWWACNTAIFQNHHIPQECMTALVAQWTKEHRAKEKKLKPRILIPPVTNKATQWAYFDGASQGEPPFGGSEGVLYLTENHKLDQICTEELYKQQRKDHNLTFSFGIVVNRNITCVHIYGDSKIVVD